MRCLILGLVVYTWSLTLSGQVCIVTDLEHWQREVGLGLIVPDYFSNDSAWVREIRHQISSVLKERFNVSEVRFFHEGVNLKLDEKDEDVWNLDDFDRSNGDLFVGVSSYINSNYDMSILLQVEKTNGKKVFKKKSALLLLSKSNAEGLDSQILISRQDFRETYQELLQNFTSAKVKRLPAKTIFRPSDTVRNSIEKDEIQVNVPASGWYESEILLDKFSAGRDVVIRVTEEIDKDKSQWKLFKTKRIREGIWTLMAGEKTPNWEVKFVMEQTRVMDAPILTFTEPETVATIFENGEKIGTLRVLNGQTLEGIIKGERVALKEDINKILVKVEEVTWVHVQNVDDLNQFDEPYQKVFVSNKIPLEQRVRMFQLLTIWKRLLITLPFD